LCAEPARGPDPVGGGHHGSQKQGRQGLHMRALPTGGNGMLARGIGDGLVAGEDAPLGIPLLPRMEWFA